MKLTYRGQIERQDGAFVIVGCHFDAEGGPLNMDEMLGLVREAWNWQPPIKVTGPDILEQK